MKLARSGAAGEAAWGASLALAEIADNRLVGADLPTRRSALALLSSAVAHPFSTLSRSDDEFFEDLSRRAFLFFWERASKQTGLVLDRSLNSDREDSRNVASSASTGFGLTGLTIAAHRGWMDRALLRERVLLVLRHYANDAAHEHGWFYHWTDADTGARVWNSEISSIDTALLLAGILTAKQALNDPEVSRLADSIYGRVDFQWMLNGDANLLSHGWRPETGFIPYRWDSYCELAILYVLAIGSPSFPIPADSWYAWSRPKITYAGLTYVSGAPLFTHQFSHAWIDFRSRRERRGTRIDWFANSADATRAHRQFCIDLGKSEFPGCYDESQWGISASDSAKGYVAWGGPPKHEAIDGSLVPCAAAGSLMFTPKLCTDVLRAMKAKFGDRVWNRYGFCDAFHPLNGWTDPDVIGIDQGITLLSAENARSGNVWRWFMKNEPVRTALRRAEIV